MHPILFEIQGPFGPIVAYSYGVMLGLSLLVAWFVVMWLGKRDGLSDSALSNLFLITAIASIVGARLLHLATNPGDVQQLSDVFAFGNGGMVAYGGFLAGALAAYVYARQQKLSFLAFADAAAPPLALGLMFTRVGCYLYGCDFGVELDESSPEWLQSLGTFPKWSDGTGSPAWAFHLSEHRISAARPNSLPVHPTQLYSSLAGLALFGLTMLVWRVRGFRGQVILSLAIAYGIWRYLIETIREDPGRGEMFGYSTSQLISIALVPIAIFAFIELRKQQRSNPQPVARLA